MYNTCMKTMLGIGVLLAMTIATALTVNEKANTNAASNDSVQTNTVATAPSKPIIETANLIIKSDTDKVTVYDHRPECYATWGHGTETTITLEPKQTTNGTVVSCIMSGKWVSVNINPDTSLVTIGD
jgi:hypothetical protein